MVPFSEEDVVVIDNLYKQKEYNARQLMAEFLNKGSINRMLLKLRKCRCPGGGRRHIAYTDKNVDVVKSLVSIAF